MTRTNCFVIVVFVLGLAGVIAFAVPQPMDAAPAVACCQHQDLAAPGAIPLAVCASCKGSGNGPFACAWCKGTGVSGAFTCSLCNGRGRSKCSACNGTGQTP